MSVCVCRCLHERVATGVYQYISVVHVCLCVCDCALVEMEWNGLKLGIWGLGLEYFFWGGVDVLMVVGLGWVGYGHSWGCVW